MSTRTKLSSESARRDQLFDIGAALVVGEVESELRQLQRNVALYPGVVDRGQRVEVDVARGGGFLQAGHAFAEVVERDCDAFSELRRRLTASAWSRVSPATKRVASRWAADEVSIHLRNCFWRERKRKKLRTNSSLAPRSEFRTGARVCYTSDLGAQPPNSTEPPCCYGARGAATWILCRLCRAISGMNCSAGSAGSRSTAGRAANASTCARAARTRRQPMRPLARGTSARAISPSPPTNSTSMTSVWNRVAG